MIRGGGGEGGLLALDHRHFIEAKMRYSVSSIFATGCSKQVANSPACNRQIGRVSLNVNVVRFLNDHKSSKAISRTTPLTQPTYNALRNLNLG